MRPRDRIAQYLVASVLMFAPFALGGAPRWAICGAGALSLAAAASFLTSKRDLSSTSPLLAFVGLAACLTCLQVVPLPAELVAILSPGKYGLVSENARALGERPPAWTSLSMEPAATWVELAKLASYLAFAYAALRVAANQSRKQWLLSVVALVGAAMAATALVHMLFEAEKVFGVYQPQQALRRPTLAPLLNHNHLSALMALSAPIAVGLAVTSADRIRLAWVGVATLCTAVGLLAESRGGAIALLVGLTVVAFLAFRQRTGVPASAKKMSLPDKVALSIVAMSALVLLGVLTAGGVLRDLTSTRLGEVSESGGRFGAWRSSAQLLQEFSWTGIGRGSFEVASTRVHDSRAVVYPHVENEYLQAAVDWGLPGAAAMALILVWLAVVASRNARNTPLEAGALGGCVALALENFTDFSLWMPGIAFPAIAAVAVLVSGPLAVVPSTSAKKRRITLGVVLVSVASSLVIAASPLGRSARSDTRGLVTSQGKADSTAEVNRAKEIFERHPSDYVSAGLLAQALFRARDQRAIAIVNRGLDLHPTSGDLYRLAGRMLLASQRREQARAAYASALRFSPRRETLDEILAAFPTDQDAVRALPLAPGAIREWADQLRQRGRVPLALAYMERYLSFYPGDAAIQLHAAAAALDGNSVNVAAEHARRAFELDPSVAASTLFARALTRSGAAAEARAMLDERMSRPHITRADRIELELVRADVASSQGDDAAARQGLHEVLDLAEGQQLAAIHRKLADIEERLGNKHQAAWERQRAAEIDR